MQRGSVFHSACPLPGQQRQETLNSLNTTDDLFGYPGSPEYDRDESQMSPSFFNEERFRRKRSHGCLENGAVPSTGQPKSLTGKSTAVKRAALPNETARIENTPERESNASIAANDKVQHELSSLRSEVHSLRKQVKAVAEKQVELLNLVKAMKKSSDAEYFDLGKCCHTDNVNNIIGQFYCSNGRFPTEDAEKKSLLEEEFEESATGMTVAELMLRCSKYESSKMSYWRSEERRRLLGITGYNAMVSMSSRNVTMKVLTLVGQRYNATATSALNKEIVLARKFIREKTFVEAKKLKDFWGSFYQRKLEMFPTTITREEWQSLKRDA